MLRSEIAPKIASNLVNNHTAGRGCHSDAHFYTTEMKPGEIVLCQVTELSSDPERNLREYFDWLGVPYGKIIQNQIGISDFAASVYNASQDELCPAAQDVLGPLNMMAYICEPFSHWITEATFTVVSSPEKLKKIGTALHRVSLSTEMERILAGDGQPFLGASGALQYSDRH